MTKKHYIPLLILLFFIFLLHYYIFKNNNFELSNDAELLIADFNSIPEQIGEAAYNNIGGQYGIWNRFENDASQYCKLSFTQNDAFNNGYALRLDYDVESLNPAYNGFWMKLQNSDFTAFNTLNIYIKGIGPHFTKRLKIELKDNFTTAPYIVDGIDTTWKKISISFEKYNTIQNWASMTEFVIVFDDINSKPRMGSIEIDHITVSYNKKR